MWSVSDIELDPKSKNTLLIIDPQVDFHDGGNLAIANSTQDAMRTAKLIRDNIDAIDEIFVTLDTHNKLHIAHSAFWSNTPDGKGTGPAPFTFLMHDDANPEDNTVYTFDGANIDKSKTWYPKNSAHTKWAAEYSRKLCQGENGFKLFIWPEHCIIGTPGHTVQKDINDALQEWCAKHADKVVKYVPKGMNNLTEMYSVIRAEVPVSPDTQTNVPLLTELGKSSILMVCGQAKSHCVNFSVRDIVMNFFGPGEEHVRPGSASGRANVPTKLTPDDIWLIEDCMSSVGGFEESGELFIKDMKARGVAVKNSTDIKL